MPEVAYGSLPFREQIAFIRGKINVPTRGWTDVWRDGHDTAFMVAGAYKADLLADFRTAVTKIIADGVTLETFRKDFDQIVAAHGWSYNGGRGWRTRVIYETNLRASYQAGRFAQLTDPDLLSVRPYWRYVHSDFVAHPRPQHLAWNGLVLPYDSPWWGSHYPPNGWGCRCRVVPESEASLKRRGLAVSEAPPTRYVTQRVGANGPNPRTVRVPEGIDPGWDYTPGRTVAPEVRKRIEEKITTLPPPLATALEQSIARIAAPPLAQTLERIESQIALEPLENTVVLDRAGQELLRKTGDAERVSFTATEATLLADAVVTHNHPLVTSFSFGDVKLFIERDLAELRAVDAQWRYILRRSGARYSADEKARLMAVAAEAEAAGWGDAFDHLARGEITQTEFNAGLYHWIWERLRDAGDIGYGREPR